MTTLSYYQLLRLTLALLATGTICGIAIGTWLYHLPIPARCPAPPPTDHNTPAGRALALADDLESTATALRALAVDAPLSPAPEEHDPR